MNLRATHLLNCCWQVDRAGPHRPQTPNRGLPTATRGASRRAHRETQPHALPGLI